MTTTRTVGSMAVLQLREAARGFIQDSIQYGGPVALDPFLSITDFHMTQPTFAPHPHAGFSAVTYMFRDSLGSFRNRDSLGDVSIIGPGDLHWTQAAHGMMHEEIPTDPGVDCHGMQLFVNLAAAHEHAPPRAFHVDASEVQVVEPVPGATVRVVVGSAFGADAPLDGLLTPIRLLDVELGPDVAVDVPIASDQRAVLLVMNGDVAAAGTALPQHAVASLDGPTEHISVVAGARGATLVVLAGAPIGEPVVFSGPFCMTTSADVADAQERFRRGEMGHLSPSF